MDKKHQQLDPQLKEAYDRVMNTQVDMETPAAAPPTQSPDETPKQTTAEQTPSQDESSYPSLQDSQTTQVFHGTQSKSATKLPTPLVIIGIVIFFLVYTFIWTQVFSLGIPFLPF